jgi:hypothetical protein
MTTEILALSKELRADDPDLTKAEAITMAAQMVNDLLDYARRWDEFVVTCSASEARNAVLDNRTPPHVREQLRQEFN